MYGALNETDNAIAVLSRAVQLGFDHCLTPRRGERLAAVLRNPKATPVLAGMKIAEADFRELVWLKSEVQHAEPDARMRITENIHRVDQQATEIPQAQLFAEGGEIALEKIMGLAKGRLEEQSECAPLES